MTTMEQVAQDAAEQGARLALARLGLDDEHAGKDMAELRQLLGAWRDAKKSAVKSAIGWLIRWALSLVVIGMAVKLGFGGWLK
ncbi:hypothetical protein HZY97_16280 [Sphingomonas sp. R-74633]|uniref:DUF6127 family protein n=1 Tax=Sphingomonas sp. R-74633 TaxID=2751188 RepID=UPI0015D3B9F6|nr:DUF6127 family protein [Sphingomonas sp. R-74633]NYT42331.1 hypothetical protein [Sphingomonas sp. R-74633]